MKKRVKIGDVRVKYGFALFPIRVEMTDGYDMRWLCFYRLVQQYSRYGWYDVEFL